MPDLPSGTVTFLFTDIEGSTQLLQELGGGYSAALAEHRRLIRDALSKHGGVEMDTVGDALFYAFARASDAIAGAESAQEALASGPVRVRMGIHTGEPQLTREGYVGLDVHAAARIAASGHGGQVVVSDRSRELSGGQAAFTDLGEHRLKDLPDEVRLFQLGTDMFPPLRSLSATNLPDPVSSFVGRRQALAEVAQLLEHNRLVTVTGSGGAGKTRFAIAVGHDLVDRFPDGVVWVPLSGLKDPELVLSSGAQMAGASTDLAGHVAGKRMLIMFDNFEHVIEAAPSLSSLLLACPNLTVLVTSRELLRIAGEREYALSPLSDEEGAALFCERAATEHSDAIDDLCRRLDGLPLAIELAAARANVLSPTQLLHRLSGRLDLFRGGRDADPRHATLRATIEWSHDLLSPVERRLFARFSVFAGGATLETAEQVVDADPDLLQALIEKSLIRRTADRYWMLETIREFAVERLEQSGDATALGERHARHILALAESANLSDDAPGQAEYQFVLAEQSNTRAALGWALDHGDAELGLRLATALENAWVITDPFEAKRWFEAFLKQAANVPGPVRAAAFRAYGGVVNPTGDDNLAERLYEQSLAEYRRLGDDEGVAGVLVRLGHSAWYRGDNDAAMELGKEGLETSRQHGNERHGAQALGLLGDLEFERGEHERGLELLEQSAATAAACGFPWWQARMYLRLAKRTHELNRDDDALGWASSSLRLAVPMTDRRRIVQILDLLAAIAADHGEVERAGRLRGTVEAEQARRPLSAWSMTDIELTADPAFDRARQEGTRMTLEDAVAVELHPPP